MGAHVTRDRKHFVLPDTKAERYVPHRRPIRPRRVPPPDDPISHARKLRKALTDAQLALLAIKERATTVVAETATDGMYLEFDGFPFHDLKLESLDARRSGIELLSASRDENNVEHATIFVPEKKLEYFLKRVDAYEKEKTVRGARKNAPMIEAVSDLRLATLRALWTDEPSRYPKGAPIWWELWLRRDGGHEIDRIAAFAKAAKMTLELSRLTFSDRTVVAIFGTEEQLSSSLIVLGDIAEVRQAIRPSGFERLSPKEQRPWVDNVLERLTRAPSKSPAVCILDTGVTSAHPLISGSLPAGDLHACERSWGTGDHDGHGTEMAGLALFGDVDALLNGSGPVRLRHALESVKILPPQGSNHRHLYGAVTAESVARVEIQVAARRRVFSMSVASDEGLRRGQPTSWSAAIDALSAGRSFDPAKHGLEYLDDAGARRLFVVCAGNVNSTDIAHLDRSDTEPIHDPAQSWNALTVGATTALHHLHGSERDLTPVSAPGDLAPTSSTSVPFESRWPLKPDVVFEGGNKAHDRRHAMTTDSLMLLTTYYRPQETLLTTTDGTSAATAQVAWMAAELRAEFPEFHPETIRGLIVHSAEWTERMKAHANWHDRTAFEMKVLRRFGHGIPNLERARRSARNAATLIVQGTIKPYREKRLRELKVHPLPWPKKALETLGEIDVRMRVTLSYFVEPNPARRGWRSRYRYASHLLRFDVMRATEDLKSFKKRMNQAALEEEDNGSAPSSEPDGKQWMLGRRLRHRGSIHSDTWLGPAAELARRSAIGIFPISGWWKETPKEDRSELGLPYALLVSIETPSQDIWTEIARQIETSVTVS